MGMYDDIRCEYQLPLPENQGELAGKIWAEQMFQTKDLDCIMNEYCVRGDGTLCLKMYSWENNRKGRPVRKDAGWQPMSAFTGTICFYKSFNGKQVDYSVEWVGTFVSGHITELKLHQWEERDNCDRLASEAKWARKRQEQDAFLNSWAAQLFFCKMF